MRPPETFLEQPVRSLQTMLRVLAEDDSRFATVIPDGIYGPSTMHAVSVFQRNTDIPVTGVTDQHTWDVIVNRYESALIRIEKAEPIEIIMEPGQVFKFGESSPYIYLLQSMLTQLSHDNPAIRVPEHSGVMDASTTESLSQFQAIAALPVTGELDKITWKHLVHHFTLNAYHNAAIRKDE